MREHIAVLLEGSVCETGMFLWQDIFLLLLYQCMFCMMTARVIMLCKKRKRTPLAQTDLMEFADCTHWIIAQDGWDEVAARVHAWLTQLA